MLARQCHLEYLARNAFITGEGGGKYNIWLMCFGVVGQNNYLPSLQQRHKSLNPERNLAVGDVFLITDTLTPPNVWPLGRITATFHGEDGLVRSVQVNTRSSLFCRPIAYLNPHVIN